jgi:hypothetical protein
MKPLRLACVSSVAATGPRAKAKPRDSCWAGLWRSPHLLLTLNSPVARGVGLGVGLLLVKGPGTFESPCWRWQDHRKLGEGWPGRGIARPLRPFSNRRSGRARPPSLVHFAIELSEQLPQAPAGARSEHGKQDIAGRHHVRSIPRARPRRRASPAAAAAVPHPNATVTRIAAVACNQSRGKMFQPRRKQKARRDGSRPGLRQKPPRGLSPAAGNRGATAAA